MTTLVDNVHRAQWLSIATALSEDELTESECAQALGVDPGSIHRPLKEMARQGLVWASPKGGGKGARYQLADGARAELDTAIERGQPKGWLLPGQRLWRVRGVRSIDLAAALEPESLSRTITWAAELGGGTEHLLAIDVRQRRTTTDPVRAVIEENGGDCTPIQVSELFSGPEFRRYLSSLRRGRR